MIQIFDEQIPPGRLGGCFWPGGSLLKMSWFWLKKNLVLIDKNVSVLVKKIGFGQKRVFGFGRFFFVGFGRKQFFG